MKVLSRIIELTKRPKTRNLKTRNVSISLQEKNAISINDLVVLKVFDTDNNLTANTTYSGKDFHKLLVMKIKHIRGFRIQFYILGY